MENPFLQLAQPNVLQGKTLPFFAAGDAANIAEAERVGVWLTEAAYIGSDEVVEAVIHANHLPEMTRGYRYIEHSSDEALGLPTIEADSCQRRLVLGWAAVYGWQNPEEK